MKKFSKNYLDIYSRVKSDKNGIFDIVTSCSKFDKFIISKNTFLCLAFKIGISA